MPKVTINNVPAQLNVRAGQTVLDAALDAGIPFPHSCRGGGCGTCRCRVHEGSAVMEGEFDEALLGDIRREEGDDVHMGCRLKISDDLSLTWLHEQPADIPEPRIFSGRIVEITDRPGDVVQVRIEPDVQPLMFVPGQYAELTFAGLPTRSYSFANGSNAQNLEFHIRRIPDGEVSSAIGVNVHVGDKVELKGPLGAAFLQMTSPAPRLLIGGGTGLAPMLSMARSMRDCHIDAPFHLIAGFRKPTDNYARRDMDDLPLRADDVVDVACDSEERHIADVIGQLDRSLANWHIHIAGPPPMVKAATQAVKLHGATTRHIYSDPFLPSGAATRPATGLLQRMTSFFGGRQQANA